MGTVVRNEHSVYEEDLKLHDSPAGKRHAPFPDEEAASDGYMVRFRVRHQSS